MIAHLELGLGTLALGVNVDQGLVPVVSSGAGAADVRDESVDEPLLGRTAEVQKLLAASSERFHYH